MKCHKYRKNKVLPVELTDKMRYAWDSSPNNHEDDDINMYYAYHAMFDATDTETIGDICIELLESVVSYYKVYHEEYDNTYIKMLENTIIELKLED